jgi:hypothetical protein
MDAPQGTELGNVQETRQDARAENVSEQRKGRSDAETRNLLVTAPIAQVDAFSAWGERSI